ncbi:hypothetical protein V8C35DRAFT_291128 [Trichoderma chlorosporum]
MNKRKHCEDQGQDRSCKRPKLDLPHDTPASQDRDTHAAPSAPPSPAAPGRNKRKIDDADISQHPESGTKRHKKETQIDGSADSADSSDEFVIKFIEYKPRPKKPLDPTAIAFQNAWLKVWALTEGPDAIRSPTPSPPPDGSVDGGAFRSAAQEPYVRCLCGCDRRHLYDDFGEVFPGRDRVFEKRYRAAFPQTEQRGAAPSGENNIQPRPPKKNTGRRRSQRQKSSPDPEALQTFLHSKRSRRRSDIPDLWCLGNDGIPCVQKLT